MHAAGGLWKKHRSLARQAPPREIKSEHGGADRGRCPPPRRSPQVVAFAVRPKHDEDRQPLNRVQKAGLDREQTRDERLPIAISPIIRKTLVSQAAATPKGSRTSAIGKRSERRKMTSQNRVKTRISPITSKPEQTGATATLKRR